MQPVAVYRLIVDRLLSLRYKTLKAGCGFCRCFGVTFKGCWRTSPHYRWTASTRCWPCSWSTILMCRWWTKTCSGAGSKFPDAKSSGLFPTACFFML